MHMPDADITAAFHAPEGIVWCNAGGRDDDYITVDYDMLDGTYSLTYHPKACPVTTPCFTLTHAAIALRDAGYSFPQITKILDGAFLSAKEAV